MKLARSGRSNQRKDIRDWRLPDTRHWVETFDLKEQVWVRTKWSAPQTNVFYTYAVMEEPKEAIWNRFLAGASLVLTVARGILYDRCLDDMLFSFNPLRVFEDMDHMVPEPIIVYDPKEKVWRPLTGLQGFPYNILLQESRMGNLSGKLVILGTDRSQSKGIEGKKDIWCVEIALERSQGGGSSGNVESVAVVLTVPKWQASVELCRAVTV